MADCGIASRRKCEEIISAGKVKVNGHPAKVGDKVNPKKDLFCMLPLNRAKRSVRPLLNIKKRRLLLCR